MYRSTPVASFPRFPGQQAPSVSRSNCFMGMRASGRLEGERSCMGVRDGVSHKHPHHAIVPAGLDCALVALHTSVYIRHVTIPCRLKAWGFTDNLSGIPVLVTLFPERRRRRVRAILYCRMCRP